MAVGMAVVALANGSGGSGGSGRASSATTTTTKRQIQNNSFLFVSKS